MYIPSAFVETDVDLLYSFIQTHGFGILVSTHDSEPFATHLPFLVERSEGSNGCLIGHMARRNPHWQLAEGKSVLTVFSGPHAYISPSWYEADNVVPTWNYSAVHAYGTFEAIRDPDAIMRTVQQTVEHYEKSFDQPWVLDTSSRFNRGLVNDIVGFGIPISRLEGKWKLSQNQPLERQLKVQNALNASGNQKAIEVASTMAVQGAKNSD